MKTSLLLSLLFAVAVAHAQSTTPPPPPQLDDAPFKVVIEEVPLEEPTDIVQPVTRPAVTAPVVLPAVEPSEPVAEPAEEVAQPEVDPVPNCAHVLTPPQGYSREVLMLQIFLDRYNFSGGVIDGVWGETSRLAMRAWQRSEGLRETNWVDVPLYAKIAQMEEPLSRHTITAEDAALVTGPQPPTWAERAKLTLMGYESLGACLAEKYHTSERTLRRLNPGIINWPDDLQVGMTLLVPNVRMAALYKPETLVIALNECVLAGYDELGVMRLRFPCSIARNRAHLPSAGEVRIKNMAPRPNYTYDPTNYGQDPSIGKMVVPPGPRNPVGSRWIGLTLPGYGIHGTPKPNTVGRPESRGCFRLTNWNAEKLFELVTTGTPVKIVKSLKDVPPPQPLATEAEENEEEDSEEDVITEEEEVAEVATKEETAPKKEKVIEEKKVLKERVPLPPATLPPAPVTPEKAENAALLKPLTPNVAPDAVAH